MTGPDAQSLRVLLETGQESQAAASLVRATPAERVQVAALALEEGRPRLAALWAAGHAPLLHAAALLRLGEYQAVLDLLAQQPPSARVLLLRARALGTQAAAEQAVLAARREGDGPALIAAATLLGELLLPSDPSAALLALAEGLKVAELLHQEADALLLAVLAHVQVQLGGDGKARKTAEKALARSLPRSPARVIALLALGRRQEATAEQLAGELAAELFGAFGPTG